ncbi:MAG: N-acetylmuramoyl-L-alanine amidase [Gammaproteobacteria bacterium]|nr:N-acetylmuramoyl-L-alanine amidase [Gammaproteobacteria bacterium]
MGSVELKCYDCRMKRVWPLIILIFCSSLCLSLWAAPTKMTSIRIYANASQGDTNRLVFDINHATTYSATLLHTPERIVIDFKNTTLNADLKKIKFEKSYVKSIRQGKSRYNTLRLVLDLRQTVTLQHFILPAKSGQLPRIVFDLSAPLSTHVIKNSVIEVVPSANKTNRQDLALPPPLTEEKKRPIKPISTVNARDVIIVIDPGHGGQDPGASGQRGTHEKNVTLPIALDVRHDLQKIPGVKVYMTRERDIYPSLGQRLALARKVKADLFVSIHADAYRNHSARGASVFALSQGRATSVGARWIAESENRSELLVGGVNLNDKSYMLRSVLVDLSQTATISESLKLGTHVKNNLGKVGKLHANRVEQASLYVLTSPDIPSILVETGFISNLQEELLLNSPAYQEKLADGITQGIVKYLTDNPVPNTRFAG